MRKTIYTIIVYQERSECSNQSQRKSMFASVTYITRHVQLYTTMYVSCSTSADILTVYIRSSAWLSSLTSINRSDQFHNSALVMYTSYSSSYSPQHAPNYLSCKDEAKESNPIILKIIVYPDKCQTSRYSSDIVFSTVLDYD